MNWMRRKHTERRPTRRLRSKLCFFNFFFFFPDCRAVQEQWLYGGKYKSREITHAKMFTKHLFYSRQIGYLLLSSSQSVD